MKALAFYKYAAGILLLLNLGLLLFFFLIMPRHRGGHPMEKRGHDFRGKAIEMLDLDGAQKKAFIELADQHQDLMITINEQERSLLKSYFSPLATESSDVKSEAVLDQLVFLKKEKVSGTYYHFIEVRELLREEQFSNFENYLEKALDIILMQKKQPKHEGFSKKELSKG